MSEPIRHGELTESIIGADYDVCNALGHGFLEKVNENAMALELRQRGVEVRQQPAIEVYYAGQAVGLYSADLLISNLVIVKLKAVKALGNDHVAQLINYLKSTRYEVGVLFSFGTEPKFVRRILDNTRKGSMTWIKEKSDQQ